jgi:retinol-binding protein 3
LLQRLMTTNRRILLAALLASGAPGRVFAQTSASGVAATAIADAIDREYHDAQQGRRAAELLRRSSRRGQYDGLDEIGLAERTNADAQTILHDEHFMVMAGVMAPNSGGPSRPHADPHRPDPAELESLTDVNFGVASARILAGNIGELQIQPQFFRPIEEVRDRYAAAFSLLAGTSAVVVNLTNTIGGDPKTVALVLSYFFDREPFVINRFIWRNLPVEEFRTTRSPGGPLYGEQRPIVVAVSRNSYSAAEEFAYDVKALERGVVVGEQTPGAANHSLPIIVAGRFTVFIPRARAENPITHTNWEGVGVAPDVTAEGGAILGAAHRVALEGVRDSLFTSPGRRDSAIRALDLVRFRRDSPDLSCDCERPPWIDPDGHVRR